MATSSASFFSELKRRQIYRGGVMYVVAGWVIVQVATQVFPFFDIPSWAIRLVIVAIILGFPVALVALWMFESHAPPEERLHDRRKNRDEGGGQVAKLLAEERAARQQETAALLAALQRQPPGDGNSPELPPEIANLLAQPAAATTATTDATSAAAPVEPGPKRSHTSLLLLSAVAFLIVLSGVWALVSPDSAPSAGNLARQYLVPGISEARRFSVSLIAPLLQRAHLPLDPELVFNVLALFVAFLIVRSFYRELMDLRYRSRRRRMNLRPR